MKTDETNIQICVVFSSSKEVKFKVPAHLELMKKVPLEWKMAVIEYTRIATSFPNAKENGKTKSPNSYPFFHCFWPLDHQSWPSGGLWSIWHCGFVSRPKDRDEVSRILARRTSWCVQVSVQVSIGVDNSLPRNLRFCSHLMGQQIFGHLFIHLSWKQISRPVEMYLFFGLAEE